MRWWVLPLPFPHGFPFSFFTHKLWLGPELGSLGSPGCAILTFPMKFGAYFWLCPRSVWMWTLGIWELSSLDSEFSGKQLRVEGPGFAPGAVPTEQNLWSWVQWGFWAPWGGLGSAAGKWDGNKEREQRFSFYQPCVKPRVTCCAQSPNLFCFALLTLSGPLLICSEHRTLFPASSGSVWQLLLVCWFFCVSIPGNSGAQWGE